MKKFFIKLLFLFPILLAVGFFNRLMNSGDQEQKIAQTLLEGKSAVLDGDLLSVRDRFVKKYYIEGLTYKDDIIVLGSSRAMEVRGSFFPEHTFFNCGVAGASLEDYLIYYWMYRKKGLIPSVVILGIDPWIFNAKNEQNRYKDLAQE
ncbi:MAG: hypothetical protein HQL26_07730 [Candidatus Omnitrophica bacterium]|nr:hypothetical protein [Candidatus Omnitrophota bacterium]